MNKATWTLALLAHSFIAAGGCLPSTKVVKNPGVHDQGVRYYRPKPYLIIRPMIDKQGVPVSGYVTMDQSIMPDFSEEYSIHVRTGLGTNDTNITLSEGWNLTGLNVQLDSQFDENLKAVAEVMKAVPNLTAGETFAPKSMAVRATNVPLGYYESVISVGCDGKKRLHGFRYVGFMPYAACPIESGGLEIMNCHDGQIYGLVFEGDGMAFRLLHELPEHVNPAAVDKAGLTTPPRYDGDDMDADNDINPAPEGLLDDSPRRSQ